MKTFAGFLIGGAVLDLGVEAQGIALFAGVAIWLFS